MEGATMEIVQGVTLEAISAPDLPDTECLLGELGSMYPVLTYPAVEASAEAEWDEWRLAAVADECRAQLDATIMAGLLWP
jgi:hypothetical protein